MSFRFSNVSPEEVAEMRRISRNLRFAAEQTGAAVPQKPTPAFSEPEATRRLAYNLTHSSETVSRLLRLAQG